MAVINIEGQAVDYRLERRGYATRFRVILMCPTSFRLWPYGRSRKIAYVAFAPGVERITWGIVHRLLRKAPEQYLPGIVANLTMLEG